MSTCRPATLVASLATVVALLSALPAAGQQTHASSELLRFVHHDVSPPLRDLPPIPEKAEHRVIPLRLIHRGVPPKLTDTVLQSLASTPLVATSSGLNFAGVGQGAYGFTVHAAPPDTNGSAGATQYVQWVNLSFAVFDKSSGALLYGPAAGNTLWQGFDVAACATNNDGDPIAEYDKAANRWVMTQLSFTGGPPYYLCIAVSQTSDATGAYNRYALQWVNNTLPDYPKIGVWSDAYYTSFNMFEPFGGFFIFLGAEACALDRNMMLTGGTPNSNSSQCFIDSSQASWLPSDLDGSTPPPAGEPAFYLDLGSNSLNLFAFHVDFTNSSNTTFNGPINIPVAAFSDACNGGGTCIPQARTSQQLDSIGERLMWRLAYRNFGDHEALLANHSVDTGAGNVGVRWYELRNPNGTPTIFQQGTYAPDSNFRWMGSVAMDQAGNIALGYSVSSSAMNPAIRYTGRVPGDPLNTLESETSIIEGTGSQLPNLSRWGDYSGMSIDPVDDCTFFYTNEYLVTSGTFNWSTRIAAFKFPSCGPPTPDFSPSATPSSAKVPAGTSATYTVTVTPSNGYSGTVNFTASGLPSGASYSFNPTSVTISGSTSGSSILTVNTANTTPAGTYTLTITASDGTLSHSTSVSLAVTDFTISASPTSSTVEYGCATSYKATITALNGFTGTVSFSASGVPWGATASFSPTSVSNSGSSTLKVATSTSTPAGTYPLTITASSGTLSHSVTVTLVVNAGDFSISASPASQTVAHGSKTTYTVTVTSSGGFSGTVRFSASGLPSGAKASFSPQSVTPSGSSTLTVSTSSTTPAGTYALTIKGASCAIAHTTAVTLVVK